MGWAGMTPYCFLWTNFFESSNWWIFKPLLKSVPSSLAQCNAHERSGLSSQVGWEECD